MPATVPRISQASSFDPNEKPISTVLQSYSTRNRLGKPSQYVAEGNGSCLSMFFKPRPQRILKGRDKTM